MWSANPTWGSPRIRDELAKLGLLRDRDSIYGSLFVHRVNGMGIRQKLTAPRSPWQNPFAERRICDKSVKGTRALGKTVGDGGSPGCR